MVKKQAFTLIEMMICLALMAMLGGFLALKSGELLSSHRRQNDLIKLKTELRHTRHLSRSMQADITLVLSQTADGLQVERLSDEPGLKKVKPYLLKHIHLVNQERLVLNFAANGYLFPIESFTVSTNRDKEILCKL